MKKGLPIIWLLGKNPMISLITVLMDKVAKYFPLFCQSLNNHAKLISEVIICNPHFQQSYNKTWKDTLHYTMVGSKYTTQRHNFDISQDHAFSLYEALQHTKNDIILVSDLDIFFYTSVDELYVNLMNKYTLNAIGIARNNPNIYSQGFFPSVVNMMCKKSELPSSGWVKKFNLDFGDNLFSFNTTWRHTRPHFDGMMPKRGHYDTGCLLSLWARENKWKWLSFITHDLHNYTTTPCITETNTIRLPKSRLLYHQSGSSGPGAFEQYYKAYKEENG